MQPTSPTMYNDVVRMKINMTQNFLPVVDVSLTLTVDRSSTVVLDSVFATTLGNNFEDVLAISVALSMFKHKLYIVGHSPL